MSQESLNQKYLVFRAGKQYYAVSLESVVEVVEPMPASEIPAGPKHCVGMMNLRGDIISVYDLRVVLGCPANNEKSLFQIVIQKEAEKCSVVVDEMIEVADFENSEIDETTAIQSRLPDASFSGVANYKETMVYFIHFDSLIDYLRSAA